MLLALITGFWQAALFIVTIAAAVIITKLLFDLSDATDVIDQADRIYDHEKDGL